MLAYRQKNIDFLPQCEANRAATLVTSDGWAANFQFTALLAWKNEFVDLNMRLFFT